MEEVCSNTAHFMNSEVIITGDMNTNVGTVGYKSNVGTIYW